MYFYCHLLPRITTPFFAYYSVIVIESGSYLICGNKIGISFSILILSPKLERCAPIHCPIVPETLGTFDRWLWLYFLVVTGMFPRTYGHVYP